MPGHYTSRVDKNDDVDRKGDAGLERIKQLEERLSQSPMNSGRHRMLARAIRIEADLYRKSLDAAQATKQFDEKAELSVTGRFPHLDIPLKSKGLR